MCQSQEEAVHWEKAILFVEGGGRPFIGRRPLVKRGRSLREAIH